MHSCADDFRAMNSYVVYGQGSPGVQPVGSPPILV